MQTSITDTGLAAIVLALFAGCGTRENSAPPSSPPLSCEAASDAELVFGFQQLASHIRPGLRTMIENGAPYLFVDSSCNYYAFLPDYEGTAGVWTDVRTGRLTEDELAQLNETVLVQPWASFPQSAGGSAGGTLLWYGDDVTACFGECDGTVQPVFEAALLWVERLYARGAAHEGPMRVEVLDIAHAPNGRGNFVEWTGEARLSDLVHSDESDSPPPRPILDGADAALLRTIRDGLRAGARGDFLHQYLELTQDGEFFAVFARPTVPFEPAEGPVSAPR